MKEPKVAPTAVAPEWDWYSVTLAVAVRVPHKHFSQGEGSLLDAIGQDLTEAVEKINGVETCELMDWEFERTEEPDIE